MLNLDWIQAEPHGLYIRPAGLWIDPMRPAPHACVTHGHADHARGGHGTVYATAPTLAIMGLRGATPEQPHAMAYGERIMVGDVGITLYPAGHVLGSAQVLIDYDGVRVVVTGDYKRAPDPTCAPFQPVPCDVLVTEATFGLPVFRHPPIAQEIDRLLSARRMEPDRALLVGAYALGKAQRLIAELRAAGHDDPIYLHGAMAPMCALYADHGVDLGDLRSVMDTPKAAMRGAIVIAPPSALNDRWARRLPAPLTAMASGWMQVRQRARARSVELPLVISDHADWDALTTTIAEVNPREVWVTHGSEEGLLRWCALHQRPARALRLIGRDDGGEEAA